MKRVFLLEGCWFYRRDIISKIKEGIGEHDLYPFDETCSYEYVSKTILEYSCFGNNKLIVINQLPKVKAPTKDQARTKVLGYLQKLIPNIPDGNIVVFNGCISEKNKKFKEVVKEYGKIYSSPIKVAKTEAAKHIVDFFKKMEKEIDFDDALFAANAINLDAEKVDMDNLVLSMYRIRDIVGGKKKITRSDITEVCNQSREFVVWNLLNTFDDKDFCGSMELLNIFLDSAKNIEYGINDIMNTIKWKYSLLLMVKNAAVNGMSKEEITDNLSKFIKLERSGKGKNMKMIAKQEKEQDVPAYSSGAIYSLFNGVNGRRPSLGCYSHEQLILINYAINKAMTKIRAGCTKHELLIPIEFVFMTICGKISKEESLRILESKNLVTLEDYYDISK